MSHNLDRCGKKNINIFPNNHMLPTNKRVNNAASEMANPQEKLYELIKVATAVVQSRTIAISLMTLNLKTPKNKLRILVGLYLQASKDYATIDS